MASLDSDPTSPSGSGRLLGLAIAAGLLAGTASWLAGEAILVAYRDRLFPRLPPIPDLADARRLTEARVVAAGMTFAAMGGIVGFALGLAGGLARRSAAAGAKAALLGLLLGSAAGAAAAAALVPNFFRTWDPQSVDLSLSLLTHGAIWSSVGAAGGLALAVGLGGRGRLGAGLGGGLAGAALATVVYEVVGALAFPTGRTELPLSSSIAGRAMAQGLVALFAAAGAAGALLRPAKGAAEPATPPAGPAGPIGPTATQ